MLRFPTAEHRRVLGITLVVTTLYLLLQQTWLVLPRLLPRGTYFDRPTAAELESERAQVARLSETALKTLPATARGDVWRLGFYLGMASQFRGSFAMSAATVRAKADELSQPMLVEANRLSQALGVGAAEPLAMRTVNDFGAISERIETDATGLAARIEKALSPHHRHLFLLGMHLGTESTRIEGTGGKLSLPPRPQIRRHATVAGISAELWEPLAAAPAITEKPEEVVARYRTGLAALEKALGAAEKR